MSPEMLLFGEISLSVDIYALGLLMVEMLVGKRAVSGSSIGYHVLAQSHGIVELPEPFRGTDVEALILKACAKQPEQRFPDAMAMLEAISSVRPTDLQARVETRRADAFTLRIPENPGSYERTPASSFPRPEAQPIRVEDPNEDNEAAEIPGSEASSSMAISAAEEYEPGLYFDVEVGRASANRSDGAVQTPEPGQSSASNVASQTPVGIATESDAHGHDRQAESRESEVRSVEESTETQKPESPGRGISHLARIGFAVVSLLILLGLTFVITSTEDRWPNPQSVARAAESNGWKMVAPSIEESATRKKWRWVAFKGSSSVRIETFECQYLSECRPQETPEGLIIEADSFWIRVAPGPGGKNAEYESLRALLEEGPQNGTE